MYTHHGTWVIVEDIIDWSIEYNLADSFHEIHCDGSFAEDEVIFGHTEAVTVCRV